jgi:hypothetical protein
MPGNLLQFALIQRYAARQGMTPDAAAAIWIRRHAAQFRKYWTKRSNTPRNLRIVIERHAA